ncbi:MAG: TIGR01212 family radical SAM protein, partial [Andreesenia angusta]|nr:TIGR01212 family radical SAM protein [Andreesenia angusta]
MLFGEKRYNTIDYYLKKKFKKKTIKLSLDGGFTCPNRDGKIDNRGCIFCSERGSGDFTSKKSIDLQIDEQIELYRNKWPDAIYLAYFQNFTNTYKDIDSLRKIYYEALNNKNISGICIATRPDCLDTEIMELLSEINEKHFLWIELGFQTSNDDTVKLIRRGYENNIFKKACSDLTNLNIKVVAHMIINLPHEDLNNNIDTLNFLIDSNIWGIKFHMLHIMKNTDLELYYKDNPFPIITADEYIDILIELITRLPKNIVVHRITGDAPKN